MKASNNQLQQMVHEIRLFALGEVRVRIQGGWITVFGSEVETLRVYKWRIAYKLNDSEKVVSGYSENLGVHYVTYPTRLENDFETE